MICMASEMRHRLSMLSQMGMLPKLVRNLLLDEKFQGHVTISPAIDTSDFVTLLSSPTYESVEYWVLKGERSTWPLIAAIRNRTAIEIALDKGKSHHCYCHSVECLTHIVELKHTALALAKIQAEIAPKSRAKRVMPQLSNKRKSIN